MTTNNVYVARINGREVLVEASHADWLGQSLMELAVQEKTILAKLQNEPPVVCAAAVDNDDDFWPDEDSWLAYYRPYSVRDGILTIPVQGMLINGFGYTVGGWLTGYEYIRRAFSRGMADPEVRGIAFVINSGGGEVAGNFDLVDGLFARRGEKPTIALVSEHAYSAAYSIASAASKISLPRTGGVGSIGVLTAWVGMSKMLEKQGIEVKLIHAGKHKVDGNPYEDLPKDVQARIQARIDALYGIFTATVARNLGLDEQVIRDTEALTYGAEDAVRIGLAHEIRAFDDAMAAFSSAPNSTAGDLIVSKYTEEELQQQLTSARAESKAAGVAEGKAEGLKEGATAERARVGAILGSDEGKERPALASRLAFNTSMSADEAKETLAAVPAEPKAAAPAGEQGSHFQQAMTTTLNPELGEGGGEQDGDGADLKRTQDSALVADYKNAIGSK